MCRSLRKRPLCLILLVATTQILCGGCAQHRHATRAVPTVIRQLEAGDDANSQRWITKNCPFGLPEMVADLGPTTTVFREGYVLLHSGRDRIPVYVCEGINNEQITGPGDRDNSDWKSDPDVPEPKADDDDYTWSGYNRGHMAPAMNHKRAQTLMDQTHYFSNAVPQDGPFNQVEWRLLEERIQDWIEPTPETDDTELFIITGPLFWEQAEDHAETADGEVWITVIGDNEVSVPTHLYKIVVQKFNDDDARAVAFVMENVDHPNPVDYTRHIKPIDWIEERLGVNFMPELEGNPELRNALERERGRMFDE